MSHKESPGAASECLRRDGGQEPPGDGASCAASLGGGASLEGGASDSLVSIKAQVKLQGDKVRELKAEHMSPLNNTLYMCLSTIPTLYMCLYYYILYNTL